MQGGGQHGGVEPPGGGLIALEILTIRNKAAKRINFFLLFIKYKITKKNKTRFNYYNFVY